MRLAHVRERHAPAGAPWRLVAALDDPPTRWLDLETARRRAIRARPALEHDDVLYRRPVTTLDAHLAARPARRGLEGLLDGFEPTVRGRRTPSSSARSTSGRRSWLRHRSATGTASSATSARCGSAVAARCPRPGTGSPSSTSRTSRRCAGPAIRSGRPRGSVELDYELEVAALIDTPARDLDGDDADGAIGGYTIFNDWSARDLQRDETAVRLGPAKGKDFASSFGPWLVTPDELEDTRSGRGYDLAMSATVNGVETSRGRWSDAVHGIADLAARASSDVLLRPGDLLGSGTVGDRLSARGPRQYARPVPRARGRGRPLDRTPGHAAEPDRGPPGRAARGQPGPAARADRADDSGPSWVHHPDRCASDP